MITKRCTKCHRTSGPLSPRRLHTHTLTKSYSFQHTDIWMSRETQIYNAYTNRIRILKQWRKLSLSLAFLLVLWALRAEWIGGCGSALPPGLQHYTSTYMCKIYAYCMLNGVIHTKKDIHTAAGTLLYREHHGNHTWSWPCPKANKCCLSRQYAKVEREKDTIFVTMFMQHSVLTTKICSAGQKIMC